MSELVTITPAARLNTDGDPETATGGAFTARGMVAPGNTAERRGTGGELESVDFTVYFPQPRVRIGDDYVLLAEAIPDPFTITIRNKPYRGRVQSWSEGGRGGVVVLASSRTGKGGVMPKPGFKRNPRVVANILHNSPGGKAAVKKAAERVLAEVDNDRAFIVEYDTDRYVAGVVVPAHAQAKDGAATRAAGAAGLTRGK